MLLEHPLILSQAIIDALSPLSLASTEATLSLLLVVVFLLATLYAEKAGMKRVF